MGPVCVPAAPRLNKLPVNGIGKEVEDGPSIWASTTCLGEPNKGPRSLALSSPVVASMWGVNPGKDLAASVSNSDFQLNEQISKLLKSKNKV